MNSTPPPPPTPVPPPPPPPPASNQSLANLQASQSFTNDAVTAQAQIDTAAKTTLSTSVQGATLAISYDAGSKSYTVSVPTRSETFGTGDIFTTSDDTFINYRKLNGGTEEYLSLSNPAAKTAPTYQYVGAGYWQRNRPSGSLLDLTFDAFTYGLDTPAAAMPRTGSAGYAVDFFGFFSPPGLSPKALSGAGQFHADFLTGNFETDGTAYEVEVIDPYYSGQYPWRGAGHLSSSDGTFSGRFAYDGYPRITVAGDINGRFYGPNAQELGAAISAKGDDGTIFAGTITGKRDNAIAAADVTLTNLTVNQTFFAPQSAVTYNPATMEPYGGGYSQAARLSYGTDGSYRLEPQLSGGTLPTPIFTAGDRVASKSNARFSVYEKTDGADSYRLTLYNPGPLNDELRLTYTSFGIWERTSPNGGPNGAARVDKDYFVYGFNTPVGILARTGSAHYDGLFYGSGINQPAKLEYKMSGDAAMDVDFTSMRYDGTLHPTGTELVSGQLRDFGIFTFGGLLATPSSFNAPLMQGGFSDGTIDGRFFGPKGEEWGASVQLFIYNAQRFGETSIAGVVIGKRR